MKAAKSVIAALLLLLFAGTATTVWARSEDSGRKAAEQEVEAGGWEVAYSGELTEQEVERGEVAPGAFIYSKRGTKGMDALHEWADSLVRQAAAMLPRRAVRNFDRQEQFQALRFTVRTVRELLREQHAGEKQMEAGPLELKAGVLEYKEREQRSRRWSQYRGEEKRRSERFFVPYVGIRAKEDDHSRRWDRNDKDDRNDSNQQSDTRWRKYDQKDDHYRDRENRQDDKWQQHDHQQEEAPVTQEEIPVLPPVVQGEQQRQGNYGGSVDIFSDLSKDFSLPNIVRHLDKIVQGQQPAQEQSAAGGSEAVFKALSLTNTARQLDRKRWEWTAYIDGPQPLLRRISSVIYYLHPSFNPSVQQGDRSKPGHPLISVGWGVFQLRAEVTLDDGSKRIYEHMLQF